jgi:hypothetical protein
MILDGSATVCDMSQRAVVVAGDKSSGLFVACGRDVKWFGRGNCCFEFGNWLVLSGHSSVTCSQEMLLID